MFVGKMLPRALARLALIDLKEPVREAADLMAKPHTDIVVVCDHGEMVGIVTKTDILGADQSLYRRWLYRQRGQHHDTRRYSLPASRPPARCVVTHEPTRAVARSRSR